MFMTDLLKEAIADAKAVREVALANAKLALEEAFTPRLQSMLASKLAEEAEEEMEEGEEEEETMEEGEDEEEAPAMEEGEDEEMMDEAEDEDMMDEGEDEDMMDEAEDEDMMDEGEDEEMMDEAEDEEVMEEEDDEDLMEIIRQLEEELESSEIGTGDNKQPSKSASDDHTVDKKEDLVQLVEEEEEDDVNIEEILRAIREEEEETMEEGDDEDDITVESLLRALREEDEDDDDDDDTMEEGDDEEKEMMETKLRESYQVIQFLRDKINEVNLLNSKLLFSNKLFRSHSLNESQKIMVIENFDRAGSLREVKLVYATLAESFKGQTSKITKSKKPVSLKETFNRVASKPVASTRPSRAILNEQNDMSQRLKKLAGLI
jgi:chemotaxis protein histidine kinase CheA